MPLDGLALAALAAQLQPRWVGARVVRITHPRPERIVLRLRRGREEGSLHCLLDPRRPAAWIAPEGPEGTAARAGGAPPTPFCMLLRKHLEGARLIRVEQPGWERVLGFSFETPGVEGPRELVLVMELIPARAGAVLVEGASGKILDGWPRGRGEERLAGSVYRLPPARERLSPDAPAEQLGPLLRLAPVREPLAKHLAGQLEGVSPETAAELLARAHGDPQWRGPLDGDAAARVVATLHEWAVRCRRGDVDPVVVKETRPEVPEGQGQGPEASGIVDFWIFPLTARAESTLVEPVGDVSEAIRQWAEADQRRKELDALRRRLLRTVRGQIKRLRRKLAHRKQDQARAQEADTYKRWADLLMANLAQLKANGTRDRVRVIDWFADSGESFPETEIPLDPSLTPAENARRYYRHYRKYKEAQDLIARQLAETEAELTYLEETELALQWNPGREELLELEEELIAAGYGERAPAVGAKRGRSPSAGQTPSARRRGEQKGRAPEDGSQPYRFRLPDGSEVRVGRNNRQNDRLTMGWARPDDIWLHTRQIPGAHVILRPAGPPDQDPDPETLQAAALLAAWFSAARESQNVPVDYTRRRHVRKPKGARPGFVIYDHQRTLFVTPDKEKLAPLLR